MSEATTVTCATCGGCRVAALVWCGGNKWKPEPCPDCSICPDPAEHERLMGQREQTWREPVRAATDRCQWCDGRLP